MCLQLSNSGDILKLLVLNDGLKVIYGGVTCLFVRTSELNRSFKVINQMMTEREIDNRGSKSIIQVSECIILKEQRVDGSWEDIKSNRSCLRCTLTGFERNCPKGQFLSQNLKNYQIRALSKLINKNTIRYHSSQPVQQYEYKMNP